MHLSGKSILVTGACGFIGSHLVEALASQGCQVKALVQYNSTNSWGWLETLDQATLEKIQVVSGDIRDPHAMTEIMSGVHVLFHLAALIAIPYSYRSPASYVETNVNGTLNLLQAARGAHVERVLVTSTSEVYGTARQVPIDEEHPRQPQSPYAATKIAADALADSFRRSFDLPVTIVRPFNTFGPRQSARAIIPTIITQLLAGQKRIRLGALHPTRDLVFVKDTVAGFIAIAAADGTIGEEINIATEQEISMGDLAGLLIAELAPDAEIVTDDDRLRPTMSEVERLLGSSRKIRTLTGWAPGHTLLSGLRETIDWFREPANLTRYKADLYNV